jgi:hypothetical protein
MCDPDPYFSRMRNLKKYKWKPDMSGAWVTWAPIGFGQRVYVAYVPNFAAPVGLVWGAGQGETFTVAWSYVPPFARRSGVRARINQQILADYRVIATHCGSKDGGEQFIKAQGYKRNKELDCFYLERTEGK